MSFKIRSYKKRDETEWTKCHVLIDLEAVAGELLKKKPKYDGKTIELVATTEDRIIGFLDVEIEDPEHKICYKKTKGNGMLWNVGVLKEFRRRGIGSGLLKEGIRRAKKQGLRRLEAWTVEEDVKSFYEKSGFKRFYDYHHVRCENRKNLKEFDRDGVHVISLYAHVMPEADLSTVMRKYEPKQILKCTGFEISV
jgi:ribosomal protein S18 acetylase RimI-like enzyme